MLVWLLTFHCTESWKSRTWYTQLRGCKMGPERIIASSTFVFKRCGTSIAFVRSLSKRIPIPTYIKEDRVSSVHSRFVSSLGVRGGNTKRLNFLFLQSIFTAYQFDPSKVLPPTALRKCLSVLYESEERFQLDQIDDAAEALVILIRWWILLRCSLKIHSTFICRRPFLRVWMRCSSSKVRKKSIQ